MLDANRSVCLTGNGEVANQDKGWRQDAKGLRELLNVSVYELDGDQPLYSYCINCRPRPLNTSFCAVCLWFVIRNHAVRGVT